MLRGGASMGGAMSAGRSFHSVSARRFWNDWPDGVIRGLSTSPFAPAAMRVFIGGRFATAAVGPAGIGAAIVEEVWLWR